MEEHKLFSFTITRFSVSACKPDVHSAKVDFCHRLEVVEEPRNLPHSENLVVASGELFLMRTIRLLAVRLRCCCCHFLFSISIRICLASARSQAQGPFGFVLP